ncbi:hypothetical protein ACFTZB_32605 [Rhodococcus sp. NPDC057014]|uniref:hypothetical protein n=1 Tax=Rhodococcus sp. NPDC057014 TaxID=3346000 RepID=UPI003633F83D
MVISVSEWVSPHPMTILPRSVLSPVTTDPLIEAVAAAAARPSSLPQAVRAARATPASAAMVAADRGRVQDTGIISVKVLSGAGL